jgi:hypothetical protein
MANPHPVRSILSSRHTIQRCNITTSPYKSTNALLPCCFEQYNQPYKTYSFIHPSTHPSIIHHLSSACLSHAPRSAPQLLTCFKHQRPTADVALRFYHHHHLPPTKRYHSHSPNVTTPTHPTLTTPTLPLHFYLFSPLIKQSSSSRAHPPSPRAAHS